MSGINEMYQNSLQYVQQLFREAISSVRKVKSSENEETQKRLLQGLVDALTRQLYEKICIGLFEQHKVVYAFSIATAIQRKQGVIGSALWNFLLRGAGIFDKSEMPEKPESLSSVTQDAWELLYCLSTFEYDSESPAGQDEEPELGETREGAQAEEGGAAALDQVSEEAERVPPRDNPFKGLL